MTVRYEFKPVKPALFEAVQEAREVWLEVGASTAEQKANDQSAARGYALQVGIDKERLGVGGARISAVTHTSKWGDDPWFLRFFEYGTAYIPAMPFIRPGARKANKAFIAKMGHNLEGKIRKRSFRRGIAK